MTETTIYCSNCGAENVQSDRFCAVCGTELRQTRTPVSSGAGPETGRRASGRGGASSDPTSVDPGTGKPVRRTSDPGATRIDVENAGGELEAGTVFGAGRYRIEECLGTGGMGAVYRVSDLKLGETVALKVIHAHLLAGTAGVERLRNEVRMARRLMHPGIVRVFDLAGERGLEFYTMEYVEGATLREVMRARGGPFSLAEAKRLLLPLLDALAYAHEQRTVHRDVKPENILLAGGNIGRPKLTDFGIAKALDVETLTRTAMALGTPEYVAPEQISDASRVDARADLYSVGVLLYEMLTRVRPAGVFEPPSELTPGLPKAVDKLVHRLLQRQPERRPSDAREVRDELAAIEERGEDPEEPATNAAPVGQENVQAERADEEIVLASKKRQARTNWLSLQRAVRGIGGIAAALLLALMLSGVLPDGTRDATDNVAERTLRMILDRAAPQHPGMVGVPAGEFWYGCNGRVDSECLPGEKPGRRTLLGEYWIDTTEVTVSAYGSCVREGRCTAPDTGGSCNWGKRDCGNHPANCVDWNQASEYCEWAGKRLPSEEEWEKAARGEDGRKYPWGNEKATCRDAVMDDGSGSGCGRGNTTWPVGSKTEGASPYGAMDMAGNVWEWTSSDLEKGRVLRGGSWKNIPRSVRASIRGSVTLGYRDADSGFRCAQGLF